MDRRQAPRGPEGHGEKPGSPPGKAPASASIRFTIPYPPDKRGKAAFCRRFGLNAYYAGKHWAQRRRDAEELHALTLACLKQAGIPAGPMPWPLAVSFWWDDGLDLDNHGAIGKAVVDALKGVLLQDDNRRWVRCIKHQFWDGGRILVELSPWEERRF